MSWFWRSTLLAFVLLTVLHAEQFGQKPDFRANVDYVEIPVRVLDNKGRFVRDLTQNNFQVLEDGIPQRVVNFSLIGSSSKGEPSTAEARGNLPTNANPRSYAIVLDDVHISREDTVRARSLAIGFIRRYVAAGDSIAIVFTSGSEGQDLTRDRAALSATLDRFRGQWEPAEPAALREAKALGVIRTIAQVSRTLGETARGARRAILLMSAGVGCAAASLNPSGVPWCGSDIPAALRDAGANDVVVYSVDLRGIQNQNFFDAMHSLANETGGFSMTAIGVSTDAFERIVSDFGEYYLLGYYSSRRDSSEPARRNEVRIDRPGAKAFYRSTYVAPK